VLLTDGYRVDIHAVAEPPLAVRNGHVVAAHLALPHPAVRRKGPVLQPVAPVPLFFVAGFGFFDKELIPELHGNVVVRKRKQLLAQAVAVLARPFGLEKLDNGLVALEEGVPVAPDAVLRVGRGDNGGVS
jgi:hypothetical protein